MTGADRRRLAARPDLAAAHLRGAVEADRFVEARRMQVVAASAPVRRAPRGDAPLDTEALFGELVDVYERDEEGWSWGQLVGDRYVGWLPSEALSETIVEATHRIAVAATFVYSGPSIKVQPIMRLSLGARVRVEEGNGDLLRIAGGGFVFARHLVPIGQTASDYVAMAECFLNVPYLWGGKTSEGLDCSGLVQIALDAAGIAAPRDSDMQAAELGLPLNVAPDLSGLQRGDLVFWKGHVGIMRDAETLLHANGYHMNVASEPVREAADRIARESFGAITSVRRLAGK